jgi:ferric-dicitrate binding protein FerR (iron transport regulator)
MTGDRHRHSGGNTPTEQELLDYLEGKLSPDRQHDLEQWLHTDGMEGDALEGLRTVSAAAARSSVHVLNKKLGSQIIRSKRKRKYLKNNWTALLAILVVLLLVVLAFVVIRMIKSR